MASLHVHLRHPDDHARLRFRADCPTCLAERLAGELPPDHLVSPKVPALLTASMLAVSGSLPGIAAATEGDREYEGTEVPQETSTQRSPSASFDPGGPETELPEEPGPSAVHGDEDSDDDIGSVEREPTIDPAARTEGESDDNQDAVPTSPAAPPEQPPVVAESEPPAASVSPPAQSVKPPPPSAPAQDRAAVVGGPLVVSDHAVPSRVRKRAASIVAGLRRGRPSRTSAAHVHTQLPAAVSAPLAPDAASRPRQAQTHRVQPGESRWSIATQLLGRGASNADIAREVNRLWELNKQRIGTGNPSLLRIGTELRLR